MTVYERIKDLRIQKKMSQEELAIAVGYNGRSAISKIEKGERDISQSMLERYAEALGTTPAYLLGYDTQPTVTDDYSTFPVIGEVAAGFDHVAVEDWSGDTVDIPNSYLHGLQPSEFFVLEVSGDSMYPEYHSGDKVLVRKSPTMEFSGQVGVVVYGDNGTLKKVEYRQGEDWMRLVPINPLYPPVTIEGEELDHCRVLGVPRLIIREVN